jgi:hypothetical protein
MVNLHRYNSDKLPNKAIIGTLFTALRFGIASPFFAKTPPNQ